MSGRREDKSSERRRRRTASRSPDPDRDHDHRRRTRHEDGRDSRRREHRDSRKDSSPRRRSSRSPSNRTSHRGDRERRHRDRARSPDEDRRRDRRRSPEDRSHRRHRDRDRDSNNHKYRPSRRHRSYSRSRSRSPAPRGPTRAKGPLPSQQDAYKTEASGDKDGAAPAPEKEKPNFGNTGRLAAESNTISVNGGGTVVLKYHEPPEARKPPAKDAWRLYVFKGQDMLEMVGLNERSCWLIGREQAVVDFSLEHPSCSKQHAAIQFRFVEKRNEFGDRIGKVKPYLIDLESANGSTVNGDPAPAGRYIEIRDKDVLRFGLSSREYVLMLTQPD